MVMRLVAVVCALVAIVAAQDYPCTYTSSTGMYYDLSPLYRTASQSDWYIKDSKNNEFFVNFCGLTHTTVCTPAQAVCQRASNSKLYGCGEGKNQAFTDRTTDPSNGLTVTYSNGTMCSAAGRKTVIELQCNQSIAGTFTYAAETASCVYGLTFVSKYACPTTPGSSGGIDIGWIFIIIAICCVGIYLGAGAVYNWKFQNKTGIELIPNLSFWKSFPYLLKDGVMWSIKLFPKEGYCSDGYTAI